MAKEIAAFAILQGTGSTLSRITGSWKWKSKSASVSNDDLWAGTCWADLASHTLRAERREVLVFDQLPMASAHRCRHLRQIRSDMTIYQKYFRLRWASISGRRMVSRILSFDARAFLSSSARRATVRNSRGYEGMAACPRDHPRNRGPVGPPLPDLPSRHIRPRTRNPPCYFSFDPQVRTLRSGKQSSYLDCFSIFFSHFHDPNPRILASYVKGTMLRGSTVFCFAEDGLGRDRRPREAVNKHPRGVFPMSSLRFALRCSLPVRFAGVVHGPGD